MECPVTALIESRLKSTRGFSQRFSNRLFEICFKGFYADCNLNTFKQGTLTMF